MTFCETFLLLIQNLTNVHKIGKGYNNEEQNSYKKYIYEISVQAVKGCLRFLTHGLNWTLTGCRSQNCKQFCNIIGVKLQNQNFKTKKISRNPSMGLFVKIFFNPRRNG